MRLSRNNQERLSLPDVVHPLGTVCFQVEIPDDRAYLAAFYGAIGQLAQWRTWELDDAHTAKDVAAVWRQIYFGLDAARCRKPPSFGVEVDDMSRFRVDPDNNCILQIECGPDQWETFWDISSCAVAGGTQPTGGGQPGPSECREYDASLYAASQWLLPFGVNVGDVITVSAPHGGWTDGTVHWYCPTGQLYALGACGAPSGTSGSDPLPSVDHMRLLVKINSIYYDALGGAITVPPGTPANSVMTLQANDDTLSDNAGTIGFHVKVCTQAAAPVGVTYTWGVGPAAIAVGDTFTMTSNGVSHEEDFEIRPCFSRPVRLDVISIVGWTPQPLDTNNQVEWDNCSSFINPSTTIVTVTHDVDGMSWDSGTDWSIQLKLVS